MAVEECQPMKKWLYVYEHNGTTKHSEQNGLHHVKEHKNLYQKMMYLLARNLVCSHYLCFLKDVRLLNAVSEPFKIAPKFMINSINTTTKYHLSSLPV